MTSSFVPHMQRASRLLAFLLLAAMLFVGLSCGRAFAVEPDR
jgi:hypothetical protein